MIIQTKQPPHREDSLPSVHTNFLKSKQLYLAAYNQKQNQLLRNSTNPNYFDFFLDIYKVS